MANFRKITNKDLVISTNVLESMYDKENKNLLIADTRPFSDYQAGHIPGAVNIDLMQFHWIDTSDVGLKQFKRQTKILFSNIGITKKKSTIFYDNFSSPSAARGVWLLLYLSHNKVAMLDGGFDKWKKEGYRIETKSNQFVHSTFEGRSNSKFIADFKQIDSVIKKSDKKVVIVDARSSSEYHGSIVRAARAGHIPTAMNIDWNDNIENGVFKETNKLEKIYSHIPKETEIITYCQGGFRAANSFIALKMLGYDNVRMYLGSWGEWGNKLDLPFER